MLTPPLSQGPRLMSFKLPERSLPRPLTAVYTTNAMTAKSTNQTDNPFFLALSFYLLLYSEAV